MASDSTEGLISIELPSNSTSSTSEPDRTIPCSFETLPELALCNTVGARSALSPPLEISTAGSTLVPRGLRLRTHRLGRTVGLPASAAHGIAASGSHRSPVLGGAHPVLRRPLRGLPGFPRVPAHGRDLAPQRPRPLPHR